MLTLAFTFYVTMVLLTRFSFLPEAGGIRRDALMRYGIALAAARPCRRRFHPRGELTPVGALHS
mgnify:CR=1 FL=1